MAKLIGTHTPEGYVIRRIFSTHEDAWRCAPDGQWSHCIGHKGPWFAENKIYVPAEVLRLFVRENCGEAV